MAKIYTRVLGKDAIMEQLKAGAYIYRVAGKFGGWGIDNTTCREVVTVRADSCRKLVESGLLKATYRTNYAEYRLKDVRGD